VSLPRRLARALLVLLVLARATWSGAAESALAWQLLDHGTPRVFWADRNADVKLRLRNVGTATWSEEAGDHLSYHWLRPDGAVVEQDGMRARLPGPVRPGETVAITARVHAPAGSGRWLLEWEMVREHVAWYGAPRGGGPLRVPVWVVRRCALLQIGFALAAVALAVAARRVRPRSGSWGWLAVEAVPVLAAWAAVGLAAVTFSEVAGIQLWRGGGVLTASAAALVALPVVLFPGRARAWVGFALVAAVGLVAVADVVYLRFFGTVVPAVAMAGIGQLGRIEGSVWALLRSGDAWLALGVASALAFALLWPRRRLEVAPARRARAAVTATLAVACLLAGSPALRTLREGLRDPATADQLFSQSALLGRWGLVNVHLFDFARTAREWAGRRTPEPGERQRAEEYFARHAASLARPAEFGAARGSNLILIQVESLQQWVVGARVGGAEITPFLNGLRSRALYFPLVFDQTGQGRSSDAEFAVLNSLFPLDRGAVAFRRPGNRFVALPALLHRAGYTAISAHPFEKGFWNRGVLHPRYGFERMIFAPELGPGEVIGWGLADGVFFSRMVEPLRALPRPYFAFLITLGLHHPFDLFPDRHKVLDVGEAAGTPLGNYIHAMHYFDASLAGFIADLERTGVLADTVVALYGDHEAGLGPDPRLLAIAGMERSDPSAPARLRRVPLFVLVPGGRLVGDVPVVGGHVDVAPTLLTLLGLDAPASFLGSPLVPGRDGRAVCNDGTVAGGERIFVASGRGIPSGGACFGFPDGGARPLGECGELARRAREELSVSRFVVIHDLALEIAGRASP
jgi:phosphoglycerol transferase MdoB-like AlkP superfamily enzyme